jgi:YrbI family 3-deoxy-D-manno-octulosonate 8-phosphate phosphatase
MNKLLSKIKAVYFDFDGVFTNNQVIVSDTGQESVLCNRSDGLGLSMLKNLGIKMAIISTEINPVVKMRANKLKIECHAGCDDKLAKLKELVRMINIPLEKVAYIGNDINDLACLKAVGVPVAVADAYPEVLAVSKIILKKNGGYGAVREFCEMVALAQGDK